MRWLIRVVLGAAVVLIVFTAAATGWILTRPPAPLRSASTPNIPDLVVQMSEDYLNRIASEELSRRRDQRIERLAISLEPGSKVVALVQAGLDLGPLILRPEVLLTSRVEAKGSQLLVSLQQVEVGGLQVPIDLLPPPASDLAQSGVTLVNYSVNRSLDRQNLAVEGVWTTDQQLVVQLKQSAAA